MKMIRSLFTFVLSSLMISNSLGDKCCVVCNLPKTKYFYIEKDRCSETCLTPEEYPYFKNIFQSLTQDLHSSLPCETYNFHLYDETIEKGQCPVCSDFDVYDKDISYIM